MYLYGIEKKVFSPNVSKFLNVLVEEMDALTFSVGKNSYIFRDYPIDLENIKNDMEYIQNLYSGKSLDTKLVEVISGLTPEDITGLEKLKEMLSSKFFSRSYTKTTLEDENISAEYFVIKAYKKYFQLIACKPQKADFYSLYFYNENRELVIKEKTKIQDRNSIIKYIKETYALVKGLNMQVLSSSVSSNTNVRRRNYIFAVDETGELIKNGQYANYLEETYVIKKHKMLEDYYIAEPANKGNKMYANSGNFITSSDSSFEFLYPIPVFDYEIK